MAVTALVLGLVGLIGLTPFLGWFIIPLNLLAIIFGIIGIIKKEESTGMSIAGLVTGAIPLIIKVLFWAMLLIGGVSA